MMNKPANAVAPVPSGTPVYDASSVFQLLELIQVTEQQLTYYKQMAKSLGEGKVTPEAIQTISNLYSRCVGMKFVVPNFLPKVSLNVCSSNSKGTLEKYYKDNILTDFKDSPATVQKKQKEMQKSLYQLRSDILTHSAQQLTHHATEDGKVIEGLQKALNGAANQVAVMKIQAQIQIKMLQEMQEIKTTQALMLQSIGLRN